MLLCLILMPLPVNDSLLWATSRKKKMKTELQRRSTMWNTNLLLAPLDFGCRRVGSRFEPATELGSPKWFFLAALPEENSISIDKLCLPFEIGSSRM